MEGSSVSRSPAQLFDAALNWSGGEDESERWALVRELQQRGDADTFELLARQVRSGRSDAVALAILVLGQFDLDGGLRWRTASVELIVSAADTDDPEVVEALVLALGTLAVSTPWSGSSITRSPLYDELSRSLWRRRVEIPRQRLR